MTDEKQREALNDIVLDVLLGFRSGSVIGDVERAGKITDAILARSLPTARLDSEGFAWLVEAPGSRYLSARVIDYGYNFHWTTKHEKALRFFDKKQADLSMMSIRALVPALFDFEHTLGNAQIVEHKWMAKQIVPLVESKTHSALDKLAPLSEDEAVVIFCTAKASWMRENQNLALSPSYASSGDLAGIRALLEAQRGK